MLVFCSKRLKLHTSIIIKLKDSVQRLLWFQTICNRKCFVKKAHALNSRLQHDKEPYVTICSYCHTNLKISIANDDFWKEAKHFCLDVNTNFCSQFFVAQHFDFCEYTKIYDGQMRMNPFVFYGYCMEYSDSDDDVHKLVAIRIAPESILYIYTFT